MKQTSTLLLLLLILTSTISAQNTVDTDHKKERKNGVGIGFKLSQVRQDFGLGLELSSPTFLHHNMGVRLSANYYFYEHYSAPDTANIWSPYFVGRLGVVSFGGRPAPFLRLYGEGGAIFGTPNDVFSTQSAFFGGYGLFGFEFFMSENPDEVAAYYIEIGGTGSSSEADKVAGKPGFHNGFTINTGFRFYF